MSGLIYLKLSVKEIRTKLGSLPFLEEGIDTQYALKLWLLVQNTCCPASFPLLTGAEGSTLSGLSGQPFQRKGNFFSWAKLLWVSETSEEGNSCCQPYQGGVLRVPKREILRAETGDETARWVRVQDSEEIRISSSYFNIGMRLQSLSSWAESKGFTLWFLRNNIAVVKQFLPLL